MLDISKPILIMVGGGSDFIDISLLRKIVETHPEWSLVFLGNYSKLSPRLSRYKSIHFLGTKPYADLPAYLRYSNVCIDILQSDMEKEGGQKYFLYLASGKPVVVYSKPFSTELASYVKTAETSEKFIKEVGYALKEKNSKLSQEGIKYAMRNNWDVRVNGIKKVLIKESIHKTSKRLRY